MSGILLPLIKPDAAATSGGPINADDIVTYEAFDKPTGRPDLGITNQYQIVFTLKNEGSTPGKATWTYPDSTTRDAGIGLVDSTIAAVVA